MSQPELSALMVGRGPRADLRATLQHLAHQSARDRFEVVLVTDAPAAVAATVSDVAKQLDIRVVAVPPISTLGPALAAGVRSARAPVIAYAEEHTFPEPGWAEALVAAHRGPWAAVSAVMLNANPGSAISWAHFVLSFGPWMEPVPAGVVRRAASHNTAYKRAELLGYGAALPALMEAEGILQDALQVRGHRFYVEPAARTRHLNVSRFGAFLAAEFHGGRVFGFQRAQWGRWSRGRRIVYAAGALLVPFLRLARLPPLPPRARLGSPPAGRYQALVFVGLIAHATGEAAGYVAGPGYSPRHRCAIELERRRYLSVRDRAALGAHG